MDIFLEDIPLSQAVKIYNHEKDHVVEETGEMIYVIRTHSHFAFEPIRKENLYALVSRKPPTEAKNFVPLSLQLVPYHEYIVHGMYEDYPRVAYIHRSYFERHPDMSFLLFESE